MSTGTTRLLQKPGITLIRITFVLEETRTIMLPSEYEKKGLKCIVGKGLHFLVLF